LREPGLQKRQLGDVLNSGFDSPLLRIILKKRQPALVLHPSLRTTATRIRREDSIRRYFKSSFRREEETTCARLASTFSQDRYAHSLRTRCAFIASRRCEDLIRCYFRICILKTRQPALVLRPHVAVAAMMRIAVG
jgi:hypothetical protein